VKITLRPAQCEEVEAEVKGDHPPPCVRAGGREFLFAREPGYYVEFEMPEARCSALAPEVPSASGVVGQVVGNVAGAVVGAVVSGGS
jgi:hypothetical protein